MSKKHDLPAMPFYVGDWLKCPEVLSLTREARSVWFDMICMMWESTERGVLVNPIGKPYNKEQICRILSVSNVLLEQISSSGVYSLRTDGAIFSRRMVKDEEIRMIRAKAGAKGGKKSVLLKQKPSKSQAKIKQIIEDETEYEYEYENEEEKEIVNEFLSYRKEIKKPYKSKSGILKFIKQLRELSGNDINKMRKIIDKTISNEYQGIFALDEKSSKPRYGRQEVSNEDIKKSVAESIKLMEKKDAKKTTCI